MKTKTLIVEVRKAYGKTFVDPVNDLAATFCELVQQNTLTLDQVDIIKDLGFEVHVKQPKAVSL